MILTGLRTIVLSSLRGAGYLILVLLLSATLRAEWKHVDLNTFSWLRSVFFLNDQVGWIVGSNGTFLRTNDGGTSWNASKDITSDNILDTVFLDTQNGWLLCERDRYEVGLRPATYLLKTADGGKTWTKVLLGNGEGRATRLLFSQTGLGIALGEVGVVFKMEDDAKAWQPFHLPIKNVLIGGMFFERSSVIVASTSGHLYRNLVGSNYWARSGFLDDSRKPKFTSISFVNNDLAWIAGSEGIIYLSKDGGKSWELQNSAVRTDLTDICFHNSNEGISVGTGGTILYTANGGTTWQVESVGRTMRFERVFLTKRRAYVVGFGGALFVRLLKDS